MAVSFRVDYLRGWHRPHLLPMSLWTGKLSGWLSDTGRQRGSTGTGGGTGETSLQLGLGQLRGQMKGRRMVQQFQGHLAGQNHARPSGS